VDPHTFYLVTERTALWRPPGTQQDSHWQALVKYLDDVSDEDIAGRDIPTGIPLIYELDDRLRALTHYYLGG